MLFVVGSRNPVKVNAVKNVVKKIWPEAQVETSDVSSGVAHQPMGEEETVQGAINRAKNALETPGADYGVGLEGGITKLVHGYYNMPWCAIVNKKGEIGIGCAGAMEIPQKVIKEVLKGPELGDVMDRITGIENTKQKMGAIGILTNGLLDRQGAYEIMVIYALARFIKPEFYEI